MKIKYKYTWEDTIEVDNRDWDTLKEEYDEDIHEFALVSVMEEEGNYWSSCYEILGITELPEGVNYG